MTESQPAPPPGAQTPAGPGFAHASEAEMARILDFYAVRWEYEPHTFPILWNLDGDVVESFSPDFFLPDLGLYLEMTTLKQRLVRKKNRKLRRLRELYPDLRIKLFYARDFRALMLKYGKLALVDALSGTPGQVPSPRAAAEALRLANAPAADLVPPVQPPAVETVTPVEPAVPVEPALAPTPAEVATAPAEPSLAAAPIRAAEPRRRSRRGAAAKRREAGR